MAKGFEGIDKSIPFFAYGLFKQDELAYEQIEKHVERVCPAAVRGFLYNKDGMALLKIYDESESLLLNNEWLEDAVRHTRDGKKTVEKKVKSGMVIGSFILFKREKSHEAYNSINEFEPDIYTWKTIRSGKNAFNCLCNAMKESDVRAGIETSSIHPSSDFAWSSSNDTMFNDGMRFIYRKIKKLKPRLNGNRLNIMFELQMLYLLLYSILNRYSDFKYGFRNDGKIDDRCFEKLYEYCKRKNYHFRSYGKSVTRTNDEHGTFLMYFSNAKQFAKFFRGIRNNAIHHGKGLEEDCELLKCAFIDLFFVLCNYFNETMSINYAEEKDDNIEIDFVELKRLHNSF